MPLSLTPQTGPLPHRSLRRIAFPGILLSGLLFAGCPDRPPPGGTSGGGAGNAKGTPTKPSAPSYPAVLDEGLPRPAPTPEQLATRDKAIARHRLQADIGRKPILEGVALLQATETEAPDDPILRHLRLSLLVRLMNEEFMDDELARARIHVGEGLLNPDLTSAPHLESAIQMVVLSYDHLGEPEKGDALIERALKILSETPSESLAATKGQPKVIHVEVPQRESAAGPPPTGKSFAVQQAEAAANFRKREWQSVRGFQLERLARKDFAAADAILEEECRAARAKFDADPDSVQTVRRWVTHCQARSQLARLNGHPEVAEQIETELRSTVRRLAESHPDSAAHFALLVEMRGVEVSRLIEKDPDGANHLRAEIRREIETSKFAADPAIARASKSLDGYDASIKRSRFRRDLIGQPAPPFDVARWVHGDPVSAESLQGKVLLLEFWSPTRAASVAAFSRLNALHEEFHDKGLEIIGVARISGAVWDPVRKRPESIPHNATIDTEATLLEAVAQHHQHCFPTVLVPQKTSFYDAYGVVVVPHSIVIDRQGKIRLTQRVPDEAGVRTIRETIESLLAE